MTKQVLYASPRRHRNWNTAGGYVAALVILYLFWTGNPLLATVIMATCIVIGLLVRMAEEIQHIQDRLDELENRK